MVKTPALFYRKIILESKPVPRIKQSVIKDSQIVLITSGKKSAKEG
jgi:hypothetical protein